MGARCYCVLQVVKARSNDYLLIKSWCPFLHGTGVRSCGEGFFVSAEQLYLQTAV